MFGHVVLTQAGISPKQQFLTPGALGRVLQGDAPTPSLAAHAWGGGGSAGTVPFAEGDLLCSWFCPPTFFSCSGIASSPPLKTPLALVLRGLLPLQSPGGLMAW